MTFAEYDYDMDIAVQRQEAFEDGITIGEERGITIGEERGREEGAHDKAVETARALLADGDTVEKASRISGLPFDEVMQLNKKS